MSASHSSGPSLCHPPTDLLWRAPTSGGQYHWVSEFAPRSSQKFLSFITGTSNLNVAQNTVLESQTYIVRLALRPRMAIEPRQRILSHGHPNPKPIDPQRLELRLRTMARNAPSRCCSQYRHTVQHSLRQTAAPSRKSDVAFPHLWLLRRSHPALGARSQDTRQSRLHGIPK